MKLIFCKDCSDVIQLRRKMRTCECGKTKGRYIDDVQAEVSDNAISVAIGNGAFIKAYAKMLDVKNKTEDKANRNRYIMNAKIDAAWIRPNTGPGNPHTKIIKENQKGGGKI